MPSPTNIHTFDFSLHLTKILTQKVKESWEGGELYSEATPTTQKLLDYWFNENWTANREINFHTGQKQAILNIIYLHEVLKIDSVASLYTKFDVEILQSFLTKVAEVKFDELLEGDETKEEKVTLLKDSIKRNNYENFADELKIYQDFKADIVAKGKYNFVKYALKLATATGKTFIMNAIIIWQYLNKKQDITNNRWTNNFLVIAPGLIVYDRLKDSFKGKNTDGKRNVTTSDILQNKVLFVPPEFEDSISSLLNLKVFDKENGLQNISDGCIILVNWHIFSTKESTYPDEIAETVNRLLPLPPNKTNSLDVLDREATNLKKIINNNLHNGLMVINDEAHHIHENKIKGKIEDVLWQEAINSIQQNTPNFFQIDFTATPYITTGSGRTRKKQYFPHIITDFSLRDALENGLTKLVVMDRSSELEKNEFLEFKAQTNEVGDLVLSAGQKMMIDIGLSTLDKIQTKDLKDHPEKTAKMMITCEDTKVVALVESYLEKEKLLTSEEFFALHSKKGGEIGDKEYLKLKDRLFNLNNDNKTKVVVSVLMLKEGFDANDICVIVPLRSTTSSILLEQTIGRGLRLMFRNEPILDEAIQRRIENYKNVKNGKQLASTLDILHIVEHPEFYAQYNELMGDGEVVELSSGGGGEGLSMIDINLIENYQKYDLFFPFIDYQPQQQPTKLVIDVKSLKPCVNKDKAKELLAKIKKGLKINSVEAYSENIVDNFDISDDCENLNYNNVLVFLTDEILTETKAGKNYPVLQHFKSAIFEYLDDYIKNVMLDMEFDPLQNDNICIFAVKDADIVLKEEIKGKFKNALQNIISNNPQASNVEKKYFSNECKTFRWFDKYCIKTTKTIYNFTTYPSHGGGFEKDFIDFLEADNSVLKYIKILEFKHLFATIPYLNSKNNLANYYPDFLVEITNDIIIVETKANKDKENPDVKNKKRAAEKFVKQVNILSPDDRGGKKWHYLIITDNHRKSINNKSFNLLEYLS